MTKKGRRKRINNRLRKIRETTDLTLEDVAALTGISKFTMEKYETGQLEPKHKTWRQLSNFYDVPAPYLAGTSVISYKVGRWHCHYCKKWFWLKKLPRHQAPKCCPYCGRELGIGFGVYDEIQDARL